MHLHVIGTGSNGNSYLLVSSTGETLMIECGVRFSKIKEALNFQFRNVVGCLVTHRHQDHCKSVKDVANAGIDIYCLPEVAKELTCNDHRMHHIEAGQQFKLGGFTVLGFKVKHDVPCLGFLILHEECGKVLFLTDTYYVPQKFSGLNNIIIEANYCEDILDERVAAGLMPEWRSDRLVKSHMSLDTCKGVLLANDLSNVYQIVLVHLSDTNSHASRFKDEIRELTHKTVHVASNGLKIQFNQTPF